MVHEATHELLHLDGKIFALMPAAALRALAFLGGRRRVRLTANRYARRVRYIA